MILGVGLDLVEVSRLSGAIERTGGRLLDRVFTAAERSETGASPRRDERLAARFAAKEAAFKALGTGWANGVGWKDVEVVSEISGRPELRLSGRAGELARAMGVARSHLSLSHHGGMAAAVVVLEGSP